MESIRQPYGQRLLLPAEVELCEVLGISEEEYFYFVGELRNQNRADIDSFLKQFEEFFNGEIIGRKKYLRDLSKGNQKKVGIVAALIG